MSEKTQLKPIARLMSLFLCVAMLLSTAFATVGDTTEGYEDSPSQIDDAVTRSEAISFLWDMAGNPAAQVENPFLDIDTTDDYYEAVLWAADVGITTGTSATTYSPNDSVTCGQMITFLWRLAGEPMVVQTTIEGVSEENYCYHAVAWATSLGIVEGGGDGAFLPDDLWNAQQMTADLYDYATTENGLELYANDSSWAYWMDGYGDSDVDCFFIAPTVYSAQDECYLMEMDNEEARANFLGASNMERGLYDQVCTMYAPYYTQVSLEVYEMDQEQQDAYLEQAYQSVREAFLYYMDTANEGRPIVLAGFSQGADMCIRLLKEFFDDETYQDQLVACYAIGWAVTQDEVDAYPHLQMAQGADDTGVIITFNTEAEGIESSLMVPTTTLSINPLNWCTDSTYGDATLNLGACFTDYDGAIVTEIPALTGAYLDPERGTLIVDDTITSEDFPPVLSIFADGIYHLYDYQFFYRNLQQNVALRVDALLTLHSGTM